MRPIIDALIVGALVAGLALPAGAPPDESGDRYSESAPSVQIGLGVRVDTDWICLNGTWSWVPEPEGAEAMVVSHRLTIGAVPNLPGRVQKAAAVVRAVRTTAICVARHLFKEYLETGRPQGK